MPPTVKPVKYTIIVSFVVLLMLGAVLILQWRTPANPKTAFYDALSTGLSEKAVSCTITDTDEDITTVKELQLDLTGTQNVSSTLTVTQPKTTIVTEEIATKSEDFVRYTSIKTTETDASGKLPDFSKVINVWAKTPIASLGSGLYDSAAYGNCVVPLANLSKDKLAPIMKQISLGKVFVTDFDKATKQKLDGTSVYVYKVKVQPEPYISLMKQVAQAAGISRLDSVDTAGYADRSSAEIEIYVDSKQSIIRKIAYVSKKHSVSFKDHGVIPKVTAPSSSISAAELSQRMESR